MLLYYPFLKRGPTLLSDTAKHFLTLPRNDPVIQRELRVHEQNLDGFIADLEAMVTTLQVHSFVYNSFPVHRHVCVYMSTVTLSHNTGADAEISY